jgi:hypothetical protein
MRHEIDMKKLILLVTLAGMLPGHAMTPAAPMSAEQRLVRAHAAARTWQATSKALALKIMEEYGPPDQILSGLLIWEDAEPWSRIVVWNGDDSDNAGVRAPDLLELTLSCSVPREKREALAAFSDKIGVSGNGTRLSVRGGSEELILLAFNLAHEIITGASDPGHAQLLYDRITRLSQAGKSSPYMRRLMFEHHRTLAKCEAEGHDWPLPNLR